MCELLDFADWISVISWAWSTKTFRSKIFVVSTLLKKMRRQNETERCWATIRHLSLLMAFVFNLRVILKRLIRNTRILNFHQTAFHIFFSRPHHFLYLATTTKHSDASFQTRAITSVGDRKTRFLLLLRCDMIHIQRLHYQAANKLKQHVFIGDARAGVKSFDIESLCLTFNCLIKTTHDLWCSC